MSAPADVAGIVLAGGRSRRMGADPKALARLGDETLLERVIGRVRPQVSLLAVNVAAEDEQLSALDLPCIPDRIPDRTDRNAARRGPLAGLDAGLAWLPETCDWLAIVPCDAPFLPDDLVLRLHGAVASGDFHVAVAREGGQLHPTFSLWHRCLAPEVAGALERSSGTGLIHLIRALPHRTVEFVATEPSPFFNVNTPPELERARELIASGHEP